MGIFSKFSALDAEVRQLLADLEKFGIDKEALTNWMYSDGFLLFQRYQNEMYSADLTTCQEAKGYRPYIFGTYIVGQKCLAFMKLLPELLTRFSQDEVSSANITAIYTRFVSEAVSKHKDFCQLQADIMNKWHNYLESKNNSSHYSYTFIINEFKKQQQSSPTLSDEIGNHITVMEEYAQYLKQNMPTNTLPTAPGMPFVSSWSVPTLSSTLFKKQESEREEIIEERKEKSTSSVKDRIKQFNQRKLF